MQTAVAIADAEGLAALSMRRVATDLESGTASLYRYVASRDDLLDLMIDAVQGEAAPPVVDGADLTADERFDFGLSCVLDGIVTRVPTG